MTQLRYQHSPIRSVQSLCRALGKPEPMLRSIASRVNSLYVGPTPVPKKNGGVRYVYDTKAPLKPLLQRLNDIFLKRVFFPEYLTGALCGRDFVANVAIHSGSRIVICEDIKKFFDHITDEHVFKIWSQFFGFEHNVSELLTQLTTKNGLVFQGTPTSSYLANLAFWDREPALVKRLEERGIRYSRFVDDLMCSSTPAITQDDKTWAIGQIFGMVGASGFKPQRSKHQTLTSGKPITIMGLNANSKNPTLTKRERSQIRAAVFRLERKLKSENQGEIYSEIASLSGKIGRLKRLHPKEGLALRSRVNAIREEVDSKPTVRKSAQVIPPLILDDPPF